MGVVSADCTLEQREASEACGAIRWCFLLALHAADAVYELVASGADVYVGKFSMGAHALVACGAFDVGRTRRAVGAHRQFYGMITSVKFLSSCFYLISTCHRDK